MNALHKFAFHNSIINGTCRQLAVEPELAGGAAVSYGSNLGHPTPKLDWNKCIIKQTENIID